MWFKNILFYRFTKPFELSSEELESKLADSPFKPCGANDIYQLGWSSPLQKHSEQLVHVNQNYWMICLQKQERILPSSVVNEQLQEKVNEIEEQQHRKVTRKEKTELKEEITNLLLPKSFTKTSRYFAYLCPSKGYLVINTSSAKLADELTSYLRKTIGSLPIRLPAVNQAPSSIMTHWVTEPSSLPSFMTVGFECELTSQGEEKGSIKYKGLELDQEQIDQQIKSGMEVTKLAVEWRESLTLLLGSDLSVKRIKFGDMLQDQLDDMNAEDAASMFDAGFTIMTAEFDKLIPEILEAFGGEDTSAVIEESN
ncbi:recombination-associated protein RdgC [Oleiphilus sp. HI0123]|nr:recombination-associated protein RdgC [Oleiphilus sp. HI0123]KZY45414.1 recombination-associated protein RdgC [Oleiphilus sp. HI0050]KZZ31579.1 recombination-associated protein RdgC [Oleiphilus sp. HI0086]KZZ53890.1 recombination-associated protein RdgC [Oleiphilus sp. HI0123]